MQAHDAVDRDTRRRAVQAAQGKAPFDLLITGGQLIDVITAEIRAALSRPRLSCCACTLQSRRHPGPGS